MHDSRMAAQEVLSRSVVQIIRLCFRLAIESEADVFLRDAPFPYAFPRDLCQEAVQRRGIPLSTCIVGSRSDPGMSKRHGGASGEAVEREWRNHRAGWGNRVGVWEWGMVYGAPGRSRKALRERSIPSLSRLGTAIAIS